MLTDMQIAVIGGDARQLEIIRKLTELDAKLSLVGFEQFDHAFTGASKEKIKKLIFLQLMRSFYRFLAQILMGMLIRFFQMKKSFF